MTNQSACIQLARNLTLQEMECSDLKEELKESERLALARLELLWAAGEYKDKLWAEIERLKEKLQKWESLAISNIQSVMDSGWENTQLLVKIEQLEDQLNRALVDIGTLKYDKNRLHNEIGGLKGQLFACKTDIGGDLQRLDSGLRHCAYWAKHILEEIDDVRGR